MHRIVVIGTGDMAAVAARRLAALRQDVAIVLADLEVEKARRRALTLGSPFSAEAVDLSDPQRLRGAAICCSHRAVCT
jgi:saccharopine dehydrogenase-like NADP-dependent oxidoreductase